MYSISLYRAIIFLVPFIIFQISFADELPKVEVSLFSSDEDFSSIENNIVEISRAEIENQNIPEDYPAKWELLFAVQEIDENTVAIAVTILQLMPDEIIEAGSKHQIFYVFLEKMSQQMV